MSLGTDKLKEELTRLVEFEKNSDSDFWKWLSALIIMKVINPDRIDRNVIMAERDIVLNLSIHSIIRDKALQFLTIVQQLLDNDTTSQEVFQILQ